MNYVVIADKVEDFYKFLKTKLDLYPAKINKTTHKASIGNEGAVFEYANKLEKVLGLNYFELIDITSYHTEEQKQIIERFKQRKPLDKRYRL